MDYDVFFAGRSRPAQGRAALSGFCRPGTAGRTLSARHLAFPQRPPRRDRVVLQRLSGHGPAPQGDRGDGGDRDPDGHRRRRHPQHRRHQSSPGRARAGARRPARQGGRPRLHLGLRVERDRHLDHRQAASRLPDPVRRLQPQFHDRGRAPVGMPKADLPAQRHGASRGAAEGRRSGAAQAHRVREPLFDGRRRFADQAASATSRSNTAR